MKKALRDIAVTAVIVVSLMLFWNMIYKAATANADEAQEYSGQRGFLVCAMLDKEPITVDRIKEIGRHLMNYQGFTSEQAAGVIWESALLWCPEHADTLVDVVERFAEEQHYGSIPVSNTKPVPNPGCGYVSPAPWSPCAQPPPIPGQNGWVPIDGIPGTLGPHGYTPIRGDYT